jgi:hypothetical protein
MVTLAEIKTDLPDWPDDVVDQWLLNLANQEGMCWPPPVPFAGHRWEYIIVKPISWWKKVNWSQEQRDCSFDNLSLNSRKIMNAMFLALVQGVDNGYGGDNSQARFQSCLKFLAVKGRFPRPPVTMQIDTGLSILDGNHRVYSLTFLQSTPDAELKKLGIERPSALQSVWVGTHEDGEVLED